MIEFLIAQDPTPWFSAQASAFFGGYGGGAVGLLGGCIGVAAGTLAPKGKGRSAVLGSMAVFAVLGVLSLLTGLTALVFGQPYHVWYPLLLLGVIPAGVMGGLIPVVRRRYAEAEQRRLDAAALRRS